MTGKRLQSQQPRHLPWVLIAWGALGIGLHIGVARFGYGVVLPALRGQLDLPYTAGGVLNAVHLAGYLAGTLAGPAIAARVGFARMGRGGNLLAAAGALTCAAAPGAWLLGLGRLGSGLGAGVAVAAILVIVFEGVADRVRGSISGAVWTGLAGGIIACGAAAPWLLQPENWRFSFLAAALLAIALALGFPPRGMQVPAVAGPRQAGAFTYGAIATRRWMFLVGTYFAFGVGYIAYATFAGAQLAAAGAPPTVVAAAWTVIGMASLVGGLLSIPILGGRGPRMVALAGGMWVAALGSVVAGMGGARPGMALLGAALVGLGMAAIPAIITAEARERSGAADYARAFSAATAALGLGQLVGPMVAGGLADQFGPEAAPLFAGLAYAIGGGLAVLDGRQLARATRSG